MTANAEVAEFSNSGPGRAATWLLALGLGLASIGCGVNKGAAQSAAPEVQPDSESPKVAVVPAPTKQSHLNGHATATGKNSLAIDGDGGTYVMSAGSASSEPSGSAPASEGSDFTAPDETAAPVVTGTGNSISYADGTKVSVEGVAPGNKVTVGGKLIKTPSPK